MTQSPDATSVLPRLSDSLFGVGVVVVCAAMIIALAWLRFFGEVTVPAMPPRPSLGNVDVNEVTQGLASHEATYRAAIAKDVSRYGVASIDVSAMAAPWPYQSQKISQPLDPARRETVRAAGLLLTAEVRRSEGQVHPQMVLVIDNTTARDLAYRVATRPVPGGQRCQGKRELMHDAVVVPANGRVERSECIFKRGWSLVIDEVETMALPELAAVWASLIPPEVAGIDPRIGRGHRPRAGAICSLVSSAAERNLLESGATRWRDVIDFYSRHRCGTYRFPRGYRAFEGPGALSLPAVGE